MIISHRAVARSSLSACRAALPAVPVFSPPSLFAFGANNSNLCPADTFEMPAAACEVAAAITARPFFQFPASSDKVSSGCGWLAHGNFYFNPGASGGGISYFAQPLCAGAPDLLQRQSIYQRGRGRE
jgi:hypothetical protein